jgi:hypothetical protein
MHPAIDIIKRAFGTKGPPVLQMLRCCDVLWRLGGCWLPNVSTVTVYARDMPLSLQKQSVCKGHAIITSEANPSQAVAFHPKGLQPQAMLELEHSAVPCLDEHWRFTQLQGNNPC